MNKKLQNIQEVTNFLGGIPKFSKKIESISSTLGKKLQGWYRYEESECWVRKPSLSPENNTKKKGKKEVELYCGYEMKPLIPRV